ncbi:helix-turn-helix domain-containing protein [Nesterenkonia lutea]|uniref:Transcriptional regulator with XRE-family HTH domain n=1 Tax=Nesterenkonia lutea TaxID=272919 RepID=A0ABR9JGU3_9MICC|nr:XRE family transcriptional regulator [Nesterenkonia lutea]MBE1525144.1 transcriptional regulator with XRE-family HTH domain [Nesterenkonia lutea]
MSPESSPEGQRARHGEDPGPGPRPGPRSDRGTDPAPKTGPDPGPAPESLLRNRAGSAWDRERSEPLAADNLAEVIGFNVRALRTQHGFSVSDMATNIGLSKAMLSKIENAQTSCSLSTLALLAQGLDVPVTSLFRGADAEREAVYTEAGAGPMITRNGTKAGHAYELLGSLRGQHKRLESLLVTLRQDSDAYPLFQHPGTEFIYMLEGQMQYGHGMSTYTLRPGDSLQFDGEAPHGPTALLTLPIRFLSVIAFPDNTPL